MPWKFKAVSTAVWNENIGIIVSFCLETIKPVCIRYLIFALKCVAWTYFLRRSCVGFCYINNTFITRNHTIRTRKGQHWLCSWNRFKLLESKTKNRQQPNMDSRFSIFCALCALSLMCCVPSSVGSPQCRPGMWLCHNGRSKIPIPQPVSLLKHIHRGISFFLITQGSFILRIWTAFVTKMKRPTIMCVLYMNPYGIKNRNCMYMFELGQGFQYSHCTGIPLKPLQTLIQRIP